MGQAKGIQDTHYQERLASYYDEAQAANSRLEELQEVLDGKEEAL